MSLKFVFQSNNIETIEGILIGDDISIVLPRNWKKKECLLKTHRT